MLNRNQKNKVVYGWYANEEIFYVGIGTIKRSESRLMRNQHSLNKRAKAEKNNCFEIRILYTDLTFEKACEIECQLIQQYGRLDLGTGCLTNMTDGGEGIRGHNKETRKRMSDAKKGNDHRKGKTGHIIPEKVKEKMRESSARKGQTGSAHPKSKPVMTPDGRFDSCQQAADYYNRSLNSMSRTVNNPRIEEYYYLNE